MAVVLVSKLSLTCLNNSPTEGSDGVEFSNGSSRPQREYTMAATPGPVVFRGCASLAFAVSFRQLYRLRFHAGGYVSSDLSAYYCG